MSERIGEWISSVMWATSLALLVLLPIEIVSWLIASDPTEHTTEWVADRWASPLWRAADWMFLVVALVHGGLAVVRRLGFGRTVGGWRTMTVIAVLTACLTLLLLGTYTLFTFELT